jgi:DNA modification methylase
MAVADQEVTDRYAIYNGDCIEVMSALPNKCVGLSVYSPPFAGLYHYSSNPKDISNCRSYDEFMAHYGFVVAELSRLTKSGRMTVVHCAEVPSGNTGRDHIRDLPGDIIRLHEQHGWRFCARISIWKDPFAVYLRTMAKNLRHRTCVDDSTKVAVAGADYLLVFRAAGENAEPVTHPTGLMDYAGSTPVPPELMKFRGHVGKQTENRYSQWVWRQYASCIWNDVRLERVLPFRESRDPDDEKHVHPLQLDVIERAVTLYSNPGDTVLTPFMGVGSEVFGAVRLGRKGVGAELKASYFKQAVANLRSVDVRVDTPDQRSLFDKDTEQMDSADLEEV